MSETLQSPARAFGRQAAAGAAMIMAAILVGSTGCATMPPVEVPTTPQVDLRPAAAPPGTPTTPRPAGSTPACLRAGDGSLCGPAPAGAAEPVSWAPSEFGPVEKLVVAGAAAYRERDLAGAQRCFEEARQRSPQSAHAAYGLGLVADARGNRRSAITWFRRATSADVNLVEAWVSLRVAELHEAVDLLRSGADGGPATELAGVDKVADYRDAIALAPSLPAPYLALAGLLRRRGDVAGAVAVLEQARLHLGDVPTLLQELATASLEVGNTALALEAAERLVAVAPARRKARDLLATAHRRHERASVDESFWSLGNRQQILREEVAALLVLRVPMLSDVPLPDRSPIITDIEASWAAPHIRRVTATQVMRVFSNHTFEPELQVARGMLVEVIGRVLRLAGIADPGRDTVIEIQGIPAEHPAYDAARSAIALGIVSLDSHGRFDVLEKVSGAEAVAAVERLATVVQGRTTSPSALRPKKVGHRH